MIDADVGRRGVQARRKEDRQVLVNLTYVNTEEAKQLARETSQDVVNLLREQADRAKRLMRRTGTDEKELV